MSASALTVLICFCRAWGLSAVGSAAIASRVALGFVPSSFVPIPGRDGLESIIWPLVPVFTSLVMPAAASSPAYAPHELTSPGVLRRRLTMTAAYTGFAVLPLLIPGGFDVVVVVRNALLSVGLAYMVIPILPTRVSWVPLVVVPVGMWLFGTRTGGAVYGWAILLRPGQDQFALAVAVGIFLSGVLFFVLKRQPGRHRAAIPDLFPVAHRRRPRVRK